MLEFFKKKLKENEEIYLKVKARPGAPKSCVKDLMTDKDDSENKVIKIDIAAEPTGGKANKELIKFLSSEFLVNKNKIKIISGAGARIKLIKINK